MVQYVANEDELTVTDWVAVEPICPGKKDEKSHKLSSPLPLAVVHS